jgi:acetyltransferase-like isoleucine patch superfamily enzyme
LSEKRFKNWKSPEFNENGMTKWNWMCQHNENLKLGKYVDVGAFTYINAKYGVEIEDYAQIGSHCSVYSHSTIDNKKGKVVIKRNARIGSHSVIMPNLTIGENAIVGAFSFVNKNLTDNIIAYGIPIKIIRKLSMEEIKMSDYFDTFKGSD